MNILSDKITFSPSDLVQFFESEFSSYMDHFEKMASKEALKELGVHRDPSDPLYELIKDLGNKHEKNIINKMEKFQFIFRVETETHIKALQKTDQAMRAGEEKIYQAAIKKEEIFGYVDLLVKQEGPSIFGNHYYIPYDFKIAKHPKPTALIQLCCYCDILHSLQGVLPPKFVVVTKSEEEYAFKTKDFFAFYNFFKEVFLHYHYHFSQDLLPIPEKTAQHWGWNIFARKRLHQLDDISLTAGIRSSHSTLLKTARIKKLSELAEYSGDKVKNIPISTFETLKEQAKIQLTSRGKSRPDFEVLPHTGERKGLEMLPPSHPADVFFDMEGYPLLGSEGLEYLYGNAIQEKSEFICFLALNKQEEVTAFQKWMDWVYHRWQKNPSMHIYHYGHYETSTIKRLMGKYGTREREVDDLLRNHIFVDLHRIVIQSLRIGVFSYSLKEVENLYYGKRNTEIKTGGQSAVLFSHFLSAGDDMQKAHFLREIKAYNQDDCVSTKKLCQFLWKQQDTHNIKYLPLEEEQKKQEYQRKGIRGECEEKAEELLKQIRQNQKEMAVSKQLPLEGEKPSLPVLDSLEEKKNYLAGLLSDLLMFHIREEKPEWWDYFSRKDMNAEQLLEDRNVIAFCRFVECDGESYKIRFEKEQEIGFKEEDKVIVLSNNSEDKNDNNNIRNTYTLLKLDLISGVLWLKAHKENNLPESDFFTLGPAKNDYYKVNIFKSLLRTANDFSPSSSYFGLKKCIHDLLLREKPDILGYKGPLVSSSDNLIDKISIHALNLNNSVFCIQGPPGTGKTYTVAHIILHLIKNGKRVGVTANSHKAISNVLKTIFEQNKEKLCFQCQKVKSSTESEEEKNFFKNLPVDLVGSNKVKPSAKVVGGTAFFFSREEQESSYDYLFVDEASQVSLANLTASARASKNLILIGDQNQLDQPIQAVHPRESGLSALTYYTEESATISKDKGVFLPISYRMHQGICQFVSEYFYNEELTNHATTNRQKILLPESLTRTRLKLNTLSLTQSVRQNLDLNLKIPEAGICFIPVEHSGNTHASMEEAQVISYLYKELLRAKWINREGKTKSMTPKDILIVAPYNVQVACIKKELAQDSARVASVDKFQGQEAPVCILSLCASTIKDAPRGISFLLNKNRLNVALSRARCLSLIVGSKNVADTHVRSIPNMKLMNIFCQLTKFTPPSAEERST